MALGCAVCVWTAKSALTDISALGLASFIGALGRVRAVFISVALDRGNASRLVGVSHSSRWAVALELSVNVFASRSRSTRILGAEVDHCATVDRVTSESWLAVARCLVLGS